MDEGDSPVKLNSIRLAAVLLLLLPASMPAQRGLGDQFFDLSAGHYALSIAVRTPNVIPGSVKLEIRTATTGITSIQATPGMSGGEESLNAPLPTLLAQSQSDKRVFHGDLHLMAPGAWKVRLQVAGDHGPAEVTVPIVAVTRQIVPISVPMAALLGVLCLLLFCGAVSIAGAAVREARLPVGQTPNRADRITARVYMGVTALAAGALVYAGFLVWRMDTEAYQKLAYKPLRFQLDVGGEGNFFASLMNDGWMLKNTDLVPDAGHFLHLFIVKVPQMERVWRLHPEMQLTGVFSAPLPAMDYGRYRVFGEIVHANGFPETLRADFVLKEQFAGSELDRDDSVASLPPIEANPNQGTAVLADRYRLVLVRGEKSYTAGEPVLLTFRMETRSGRPVDDLELYLGMPAQAFVLKHDQSVFARLNPLANVPMVSLRQAGLLNSPVPPDMRVHSMNMGVPAEFSFPYGFPSAGNYRIFVQIRRAGKVETGAFDINVVE